MSNNKEANEQEQEFDALLGDQPQDTGAGVHEVAEHPAETPGARMEVVRTPEAQGIRQRAPWGGRATREREVQDVDLPPWIHRL